MAWRASPAQDAQVDLTLSQFSDHLSREGGVPLRNPDEVPDSMVGAIAPSARRAFRAPQGVDRARLTDSAGSPRASAETGFAWQIGMGGGPTGAPVTIVDEAGHQEGKISGIGLADNGAWNSMLPRYNEPNSHLGPDRSDPRTRDNGNYTTPVAKYDPNTVRNVSEPAAEQFYSPSPPTDQKPNWWFLTGRRPKHGISFSVGPFDRQMTEQFTGDKLYPRAAPDVSGSGISNVNPHASMPNRNNVDAPNSNPGGYAGGKFGPSGMQPGMPTVRNTWRLQPVPWDEDLITP